MSDARAEGEVGEGELEAPVLIIASLRRREAPAALASTQCEDREARRERGRLEAPARGAQCLQKQHGGCEMALPPGSDSATGCGRATHNSFHTPRSNTGVRTSEHGAGGGGEI